MTDPTQPIQPAGGPPTQPIGGPPTQPVPAQPAWQPPPQQAWQPTQPPPQQAWQPTQPTPPQQGWQAAPAQPGWQPPQQPPVARRGRPALLVALLVAGLVLVGGVGAFALTKLVPRGAQPDTVIPASALAYARIDLDPAAGQKVAAVRFLAKLPGMSGVDGSDPRATLWKAIASRDPDLRGVDYATEVSPWLGDRAAAAVLPGDGKKPVPVLALAVTDETKGSAGINALLAKKHRSDADVVTRSGYALITPKGASAGVLAELDKGSLATNAAYTGDLAALGDTGVASMWADAGALAKLTASASHSAATVPPSFAGRMAAAVRFDPAYVELAGVVRGISPEPANGPTASLATLPADTIAAVEASGLGNALRNQWPTLEGQLAKTGADLAQVEARTGLSFPDDLVAFLGDSFMIALPDQDFAALGRSDVPALGVVSTGPQADRAADALRRLSEAAGIDNFVNTRVVGGSMYAATTPDYLDRLATAGTLGQKEAFALAVRDPQAQASAFVDLDALERYYLDSVPADSRDAVRSLRAVGMSVVATGPGSSAFSLRVVGA